MQKKFITFILLATLVTMSGFSSQLGRGIIQRAEVHEGLTAGGTLGLATWPGLWSTLNLSLAGEYGFSDSNPENTGFSIGNLAAGFSASYDRTRINFGSFWGNYVWRYNNFKFGPYAKYQILNPERSRELINQDWAGFFFSGAAGFKLNFNSYTTDSTTQQLTGYGALSNLFLVDVLLLADYPLSNVVEEGFFSNLTLTLTGGVLNNRFSSSLFAWYDTPNFKVSAAYRFLLGAEVSVIVPF